MAASNTRFTQNSLGQSKTPIDSDHGIYRYCELRGRSPSKFSVSGRRRCRAADGVADCAGASLPYAAGAHHLAIRNGGCKRLER